MSTMTTQNGKVKSNPKARKPVPRSMTWRATSQAGVWLVRITVGKESELYQVTAIPADEGKGFQVTKCSLTDPQVYHVRLCGLMSECSCRGFQRWQKCKHHDCLAHQEAEGLI